MTLGTYKRMRTNFKYKVHRGKAGFYVVEFFEFRASVWVLIGSVRFRTLRMARVFGLVHVTNFREASGENVHVPAFRLDGYRYDRWY